ncbi:MAG: sugar ABC transporter permease [Armatimonadota bacterium]|nr:sugar ABC transporter permease [Armatimonadota bacterium]
MRRAPLAQRLQQDPYFGYLLILPLLTWALLTLAYPLADTIRLSVLNVGYVGTSGTFAGLANFRAVLASSEFWSALRVSVVWTALNVALQLALALVTALVLNQDFRGREVVRNWIILPWLFPSIVLATMGKWVLDPTLGVVNYLLLQAGLIARPLSFLGSVTTALYAVTAVNVWRWFPFFSVIILAALQTIPRELGESADIDGAGYLARLWYVELPVIGPVLRVVILIACLWAVNIFDAIWLLTRGGPRYATTTFSILIYYKGFVEHRISHAATVSLLMFLMLLAFGLLYFRYVSRPETEAAA